MDEKEKKKQKNEKSWAFKYLASACLKKGGRANIGATKKKGVRLGISNTDIIACQRFYEVTNITMIIISPFINMAESNPLTFDKIAHLHTEHYVMIRDMA